jgi:Xaa-Pro aminopeptidase
MIVSIEPGYYDTTKYGIRIENLYHIAHADDSINGNVNKSFLKFVPLTLIPFQRKLIDVRMMNASHIKWVNDYHNSIYETISPWLKNDDVRKWLYEQCKPLSVITARNISHQ